MIWLTCGLVNVSRPQAHERKPRTLRPKLMGFISDVLFSNLT